VTPYCWLDVLNHTNEFKAVKGLENIFELKMA